MILANEVAKKLLQINAIKLSPQKPFTWASGMKSPIYCDNRLALSFPEIRKFLIDGFVVKSADYAPFDLVAGVATAGIAYGALLAEKLDLPFVYVRSKAKGHGRQNRLEGKIKGGERVLVVEDLISTGGSSLKAVKALRKAGCKVRGVVAIFTYGLEEAVKAFEKDQCPFETLSNYDVLIEQAIKQSYVAEEYLETLRNWRKAPAQWGESIRSDP